MHIVKSHTDELAILGAPMNEDDLIERILDGLGNEYKKLVRAIQARDTTISFDELHEKLLTFETILLGAPSIPIIFLHLQIWQVEPILVGGPQATWALMETTGIIQTTSTILAINGVLNPIP